MVFDTPVAKLSVFSKVVWSRQCTKWCLPYALEACQKRLLHVPITKPMWHELHYNAPHVLAAECRLELLMLPSISLLVGFPNQFLCVLQKSFVDVRLRHSAHTITKSQWCALWWQVLSAIATWVSRYSQITGMRTGCATASSNAKFNGTILCISGMKWEWVMLTLKCPV